MKLSGKFQALCALALASVASAAAPMKEVVAALYSMANDNAGNAIMVFDIYDDGTIAFNKAYPTGGNGGTQIYHPMLADALRSEGSILVSGDRLFQVNAGSDSLAMWSIDPHNPANLTMMGQPIWSGGEFPVSIHVHPTTSQVCVANAGSNNGVQCYSQSDSGLTMMPNTNRPLGFPQSSPPTFNNSINSLSTVLFSRDGSKLLVDVKGLTDENEPGFIAAWDVNADGSLSIDHRLYPGPYKQANETGGGSLNFGMSYLPEGHEGYILADPSIGGIVYDFSKGYGPQDWVAKSVPIPGQEFTCWATYAKNSDSYFFSDFGTQEVYEVKIDLSTYESNVINRFQIDPVKTVNIDHRLATIGENQYLYQLAPYGSLITVFDVQPEGKTKVIQSYNFSQPMQNAGVPFTIYSPAGLYYHLKN